MPVNAAKDENSVSTIIGASSTDGKTIVRAEIDPVTHRLLAQDGTTGSDFGTKNASRDENHVPVWIAVSNVDGQTPVEIYLDPITHRLLIDSA